VFRPPETEPFCADLDALDQIALRNHADQLRVDIDDRERADAVTHHRIGRDLNGVSGPMTNSYPRT
jgi:hypothetical protein